MSNKPRDPKADPLPDGSGDVLASMIVGTTPKVAVADSRTVREHPEWFEWWRPLNRAADSST